jgi:hypothetical protein
MHPEVGRMVIYKITEEQAVQINRRRTSGREIAERIAKNTPESSAWPLGAQAHIGNVAVPGQYFPMVIVRIWPDEFGPYMHGVNGQVFLDGNDTFWVTSASQGTSNGQWDWPPQG